MACKDYLDGRLRWLTDVAALHNQEKGDGKAWQGQQEQREGGFLALRGCVLEASLIAKNISDGSMLFAAARRS
jgi:hypothetical protein